jgi:hypothetical protein
MFSPKRLWCSVYCCVLCHAGSTKEINLEMSIVAVKGLQLSGAMLQPLSTIWWSHSKLFMHSASEASSACFWSFVRELQAKASKVFCMNHFAYTDYSIQNCRFACCCSAWVRNLVCHSMGITQVEDVENVTGHWRRFLFCATYQILIGLSNVGGWSGLHVACVANREVRAKFCWGSLEYVAIGGTKCVHSFCLIMCSIGVTWYCVWLSDPYI